MLGQDLALALKHLNTQLSDNEEGMDSKFDYDQLLSFGRKVKSALQDVWKDPGVDVFDVQYVRISDAINDMLNPASQLSRGIDSYRPLFGEYWVNA